MDVQQVRRFGVAVKRRMVGPLASNKGGFRWTLERRPTESHSDYNSFHCGLSVVLTAAQCCALMPVAGVRGSSVADLRFNWCSGRVLFGLLMAVGSVCSAGFGIALMFHTGFSISRMATVVFYVVYVINLVLFLDLARKWPELSRQVHQVEVSMVRNYGYPPRSTVKLRTVSVIFLLVGLVECLLTKLHSLNHAFHCSSGREDPMRYFFTHYYPYVFRSVEYSGWLSVVVVLVDVTTRITWNYIDTFLMLMGFLVASRFQQINRRLRAAQAQSTPDHFWGEMREDFNRLSYLMRIIDSHVSKIVLLSFACNLYFVCLQLLSSTQPRLQLEEDIFFYGSFSYLLLRTVSVVLSTSQVNEESKKPRRILFTLPSESFNIDARRLLYQVITDEVAFTGLNFFSVTRQLLLTLVGTVITYEIVLVQLNTAAEGGGNNITDPDSGQWHRVEC